MARSKPNRQPIQLEMVGGRSARQRIWEVLKSQQGEWRLYPVARAANVDDETLKTYVRCLRNGGYLERVSSQPFKESTYRMLKTGGAEAPRLDRRGNPVTQGLAAEAMWRTLRILGELDARQIAEHASAAGIDVTLGYAKRYLGSLKKAGYLEIVRQSAPHRLEKIRLRANMNTGPHAPQIQRLKTVYDPNLNRVMHSESAEDYQ